MTDQDNTPPAVWDPTARGGAGGWVRRRAVPEGSPPPAAPPAPPAAAPSGFPPQAQGFPSQGAGQGAAPQAPGGFPPPGGPRAVPQGVPPRWVAAEDEQSTTLLPPVPTGGFGDAGPPIGARPYVSGPPGFPPQAGAQAQGFPPQPQGFPPQGAAPFDGAARPPFPGFDPSQAPARPFGAPAPAYEDLDEEEPPRNRTPLLIAAGVALVLLIGVGVVWAVQNSDSGRKPSTAAPAGTALPAPRGGGGGGASAPAGSAPAAASPSGGASAGAGAEGQAKALDALLARGESAKAPIGSAVAKVTSCPDKSEVESAAQVFDDGAVQRDKLVADLGKLDLGDLPGGAEAAQTLKTAWQTSGDIDRAYAAWARTVAAQGCSGSTAPNTADKKRANDLNPQATQSKKDFVAKWNAIAKTYGLTERTWDRI
ncbi:hypothetical protein [Kitasatospora sp. KL5]|uniref:hypothetical protein n=1 Tax=Kitasatospora sp. KL5 TaxID=3425125 RepID=UPI003D6DFDD0